MASLTHLPYNLRKQWDFFNPLDSHSQKCKERNVKKEGPVPWAGNKVVTYKHLLHSDRYQAYSSVLKKLKTD